MDNVESYFLQPGYIFVSQDEYNINTVLGSCVSICLWDKKMQIGGMNHYIYANSIFKTRSARCGIDSIPYLIKLIRDQGSNINDLTAHIVGGSQ